MSTPNKVLPLEYAYQSNHPFKTLWRLLNLSWAPALWMLFIFLVKQSPAWLIPIVTKVAIDHLTGVGSIEYVYVFTGIVMVLVIFNVPLHTYFIAQLSGYVRRMERRVRRALVTRLQQLSIPYHDSTESGRLLAKVLRDVEQIQIMTMQLGEMGVMIFTTITFIVVATAVQAPVMLIAYSVVVPIAITIIQLFNTRIREQNRHFRSNIESMNSEVGQMITMIPVSRAHGIEHDATVTVNSRIDEVNTRGTRLDRLNALLQSSSWATFQTSALVILFFSLYLAKEGEITVGDVTLFQGFYMHFVMQCNMVLNMYPQLAKGFESINSVGEVLECPDLEENQGKDKVDAVRGEIRYENLSYTYNETDQPAVKDLNLDIQAGETVAVVGYSGSGKSTLMRLTIGFRRPTSGRILLDGRDMEEIDMRTWRRFISVVPQESVFFEASVRDNILFGSPDVSEAQLQEILEAANVVEFIDKLPNGLDTMIGENGARLSGGQRQRLAIARALVRDPKVIVLDEPTSALDVVSEKLVQDAIDRMIQNRTTLIVAHRLSTIRNANRILVMQQGELVEHGTYDELMAKEGVFFQMKDLQS